MNFDGTIHLSDFVGTVVGAILTIMGWGMRKTYRQITHFIRTVDNLDVRHERTALVVDKHTDALDAFGLIDAKRLPRVSRRRRSDDLDDVDLDESEVRL